jgi:hypothetical protein
MMTAVRRHLYRHEKLALVIRDLFQEQQVQCAARARRALLTCLLSIGSERVSERQSLSCDHSESWIEAPEFRRHWKLPTNALRWHTHRFWSPCPDRMHRAC